MAGKKSWWIDSVLVRTEQDSIPQTHVAMPMIVTILDTLAILLGVYHAVLDLTNAFYSLLLATESQD